MQRRFCLALLLAAPLLASRPARAAESLSLRQRLQHTPFKIAYESYVNDNWEIFVMEADGTHPLNLTRTPSMHERLQHLYNPSFAPNGKWIAATVHAGMGLSHAIVLIEATGNRIINLNIPGCRPCLSPDGGRLLGAPATMNWL